jgi:RNA polymerase sigma-70 factor (ECF subfamily)
LGLANECASFEPNESAPPNAAEAARSREGLQFRELYEAHVDLVWRALRRYGVQEAALEDAAQEVFLIVHAKLGTFEGRGSLRSWVYGIARRAARDHRRDRRTTRLDSFDLAELRDLDPCPQASAEQRADARLLRELLAELSDERRELVELIELEQLSMGEAAEILEENVNTLYSRHRQAKRDLEQSWTRRRAREARGAT